MDYVFAPQNHADAATLVAQFVALRRRSYEVLLSDSCVVADGLKAVCFDLLEEAHAWIEVIGAIDFEACAVLQELQKRLRVLERAAMYFAHLNCPALVPVFSGFLEQQH